MSCVIIDQANITQHDSEENVIIITETQQPVPATKVNDVTNTPEPEPIAKPTSEPSDFTGLVTTVSVSTPPIVNGDCSGPNTTSFNVKITTDGPAIVLWHFEIVDTDGELLNSTADQSMIFTEAGTQEYDSDAYKSGCGSYIVKVVTTSPNVMTAQASWEVIQS